MRRLLVLAACLLVCSGLAMADIQSFTFTGSTITVSGWLDLTGNVATAGSATFSWTLPPPGGGPLTGSLLAFAGPGAYATSPSGKFWYDSSLAVGAYGILFVAGDGTELNIWRSGADTASIFVSGSADYIPPGVGGWGEAGTLTVPDGGLTLTLLGGALVGLEGLRRRIRA